MIRRLLPIALAAAVVGAFIWTLLYLHQKSQAQPIVHETAKPVRREIVKKTVAPGALVPRKEVTIKPRVSGVIEKLYVEPGMYVKARARIAKIQIIPDVVRLNQAEAGVHAAEINRKNTKQELDRGRSLHQQGLMSEAELERLEFDLELRKQELEAAENNLQLVRVGASKRSGQVSNMVHATVDGMVLEVPVKEGASVIEANNFNEGTTIASVADMRDMIFQGRVDESDVGGLKEGMPVSISVGALSEQRLDGSLEYIAPKGQEKDGTIEFEVRASVKIKPGVFVRANYSANADIILDRRRNVLAVNESWVKFEGKQAFVDIEKAPQKFERRRVELGLSDGIWVEVKSGLKEGSRIKKQETLTRPSDKGPSRH